MIEENTKEQKTEIICIVDRSGSMHNIREDAQGGVNAFIEEQQALDTPATFTLIEFDTSYDVLHERAKLADITPYTLQPRGGTALYDTIGKAVTGASPANDIKKIVVIITDGDDRNSTELSVNDIKKLITEKQDDGWDFVFLAANQDAFSAGRSMGIDAATTAGFVADAVGTTHAYGSVSTYVSRSRLVGKAAAVQGFAEDLNNLDNKK